MSRSLQLLLPGAALVLIGCGGGGSNPPAPSNIAPTITTHPQSQTTDPGMQVTFNVQATGTPAPSFQWKRNGSAVPNATQSSYTVTPTASDDQAEYVVTVSNAAGSVDSQKAVLTVRKSLSITTQPTAIDAVEGQPVALTVLAAGTGVQYQWYRNDVAIPGATTGSLTFAAAKLSDAGTYHAVVTDSYKNSVTSAKVPVTVKAPSAKLAITVPNPAPLESGTQYISKTNRFTATVPVTLNRGGLVGPATLSVVSIATGLNAGLDMKSLSADQSGATLSVSTMRGLGVGTYTLFLKAECAGEAILAPVTVTVVPSAFDYQLNWLNENESDLDQMLFLPGDAGKTVQRGFVGISTKEGASKPANTTINYSFEGLPAGITATITPTAQLGYNGGRISLAIPANFPTGIYSFRLKSELNGLVRYLPTALMVGKGTLWTKPIRPVTLAAGQSLTFPIDLGRNDQFYSNDDLPAFLGETRLSYEAPAGLTVNFPVENPIGTSTAAMVISAAAGTSAGTYTVKVKATRGTVTDTQDVSVNVRAASDARKVSLQKVEWGQSVLMPDLRLVDGKPALLRLHLLGDAPGITAAPVSVAVKAKGATLDTFTLSGPTTVPTTSSSEDFKSTWQGTLPANVITPGMSLEISYNGTLLDTVTPVVGAARDLDLVIVPVIQSGLVPTIASEATIKSTITSIWPARSVKLTFRAPYTTSVQVPSPDSGNNVHATAVLQVLAEVASLRLSDKSTSDYYGFLNTGYSWGILGVHQGGWATGIGIDSTKRGEAESMGTFQHELGHGFNLRHSPDGDASGPTNRFPYSKVSIGSVGVNVEKGLAYYPSRGYTDIMSYQSPQWVSDFTYQRAQGYFEGVLGVATPPNTKVLVERTPHTLVTGGIAPNGTVTLFPVQHVMSEPRAALPGNHTLKLVTTQGVHEVDFHPEQVDCAPKGFRFFNLLVPGHLELKEAAVLTQGHTLAKAEPSADYRTRVQAAASASFRSLEQVKEEDGKLTVRWDASLHPFVSIAHVSDTGEITTLGLNHKGGEITLPIQGLPAGGQFRLTYSDGLNPVHRMIAR